MRLESLIVGPYLTDTGQRVEFHGLPLKKTRQIWCEWMRRHSIDPGVVPASEGWLERRPEDRQVAYVAYKLNEAGKPFLDPETDDAVRETVVVQLEAEPEPFPEVGR